MADDDTPNAEPTAITPIYEYWESAPGSYSARILAKLLRPDAASEDVFPLKLTGPTRNAIARSVTAACDEKIADCLREITALKRERDQSNYQRVITLINTPLIAAGSATTPAQKGEDKTTDEEKQKRLDAQEAQWFLRYLTLRNILAFLVVFLGIVGSVIGFAVNEYQNKLAT
jgi:hypothetical protein